MIKFEGFQNFTDGKFSKKWTGVVLINNRACMWTEREYKTRERAKKNAESALMKALECSHKNNQINDTEDQDHKGDRINLHQWECSICGFITYMEFDDRND